MEELFSLDINELDIRNMLEQIPALLDISKEEMYDFWELRLKQVLQFSGFNFESNSELAKSMFSCCREYIYKNK